MIPRVLHQTWKTAALPARFKPYEESWARHNPGLERRFWTDRDLLAFVEEHYPDLLDMYCNYPNPVMRADAGRYMLLHRFGGVYADIDCECVASLEPLFAEDRIVFCREPDSHSDSQTRDRGLSHLLFNGMMASPPGHSFWREVLDMLPRMAGADSVLDATGPCMLSGMQMAHRDRSAFAVHPPALFCPIDGNGNGKIVAPDEGGETLAVHHWAGTWWTKPKPPSLSKRLRASYYKLRHKLTRGDILDPEQAQAAVDPACLNRPAPQGQNVAILVPARDAADHVAPFLQAIGALDHPKSAIKLVFCEGDSADDTRQRLEEASGPLKSVYRDVVVLEKSLGNAIPRQGRAMLHMQRVRRAGIAAVRNHLIHHGLDESDDWALWIDIDVWSFPGDIIATLLQTGRRIVAPHCVKVPGGRTFDMNSFIDADVPKNLAYWRSFQDGLYQPPARSPARILMSTLRYRDIVDLHGVGGTMLLVDAALHRGGLTFPEKPYRDLIETEGFGALANDLGVVPAGLPNVEIQHVPW